MMTITIPALNSGIVNETTTDTDGHPIRVLYRRLSDSTKWSRLLTLRHGSYIEVTNDNTI